MRALVLGLGAVGTRTARQLASSAEVEQLLVVGRDAGRAEAVARSLGPVAVGAAWGPTTLDGVDVLVVAAPVTPTAAAFGSTGFSVGLVERAVRTGTRVVTVSDHPEVVHALLGLDEAARRCGTTLVVGAGMSPGLTDVLARFGALQLGSVDEIHVAKVGAGGPACARQHHRALTEDGRDWRDGSWVQRASGSGRELCWFPEPVGGRDCYRAGLSEPRLLVRAFSTARRITARVAATRRDRLSAPLPMLRKPHPEGELGAVRVEVRGERDGRREVRVYGVLDRPAGACGAVAAVSALWAVEGRFTRTGAAGLAELVVEPGPFLAELARRGVKAAAFEGSAAVGAP